MFAIQIQDVTCIRSNAVVGIEQFDNSYWQRVLANKSDADRAAEVNAKKAVLAPDV